MQTDIYHRDHYLLFSMHRMLNDESSTLGWAIFSLLSYIDD